jgi:hypothetical protein
MSHAVTHGDETLCARSREDSGVYSPKNELAPLHQVQPYTARRQAMLYVMCRLGPRGA